MSPRQTEGIYGVRLRSWQLQVHGRRASSYLIAASERYTAEANGSLIRRMADPSRS